MLFFGAILEMAAILKSYAMGPLPILIRRSKCTILEVLTLLSLNPRFWQKSAPLVGKDAIKEVGCLFNFIYFY